MSKKSSNQRNVGASRQPRAAAGPKQRDDVEPMPSQPKRAKQPDTDRLSKKVNTTRLPGKRKSQTAAVQRRPLAERNKNAGPGSSR